jgi:hypothetical protein
MVGGAARGKKTMLLFLFFFRIYKIPNPVTRLSTHQGLFPFLAALT